jgi:hypothetical protein
MQSQTISEVERLLQTEMADLEKFYQEFGEEPSPNAHPSPSSFPKSPKNMDLGQMSDLTDVPKPNQSLADPLRNSTRFMKSGDFFEYIENMVEQDIEAKKKSVTSNRNIHSRLEEISEDLPSHNLDLSQARNLDVEMNVQSAFLDNSKQGALNRINNLNKPEVEEKVEMGEILEEREEVIEPEVDEPVKSRRNIVNEEMQWRRNNDFSKSIDERVISTKKKTFEQMLEEALKKEGQSFIEPAPAPPSSRKKTNFLKKNTSRRRFLNKKKKNNLSKYGRANFKKKKKPKKEEKGMTESMLEFEQMEQINGNKSVEDDKEIELKENPSIEEMSVEKSENEDIDFEYLKMGNKEGEEEDNDEEEEEGEEGSKEDKISRNQLKKEIAKVKKQIEAKFKRKIDELNREIRKYKSRNKDLEDDRKKIKKLKKKIEEDKVMVDRLKADKKDFENYKQKEMEKIKREKAVTKRNAKAYRATTNKKDKEAIDNLKREMRILREQSATKEKKMKEAIERRKRKIEQLKNDNEDLRGQVDFYEKMRMKKSKQEKEEEEEDQDEESGDDSDEEETGEDSEDEQNVKSLKTAISKLSKKKGKDKKEIKKFLTDFYAGFDNPIPNVDKGTLKINNENYKYDENTYFKKYKWNQENDLEVVQEEESEGKVYKTFSNGRKEIKFSNGAVKEIMPDGYIIGKK